MSEHIIDWDENLVIDTFSKNTLREEIVRCKDCKYNDGVINACIHPWITPLYGDVPLNYIFTTVPDGFCAWGKRYNNG